MTHRAFKFRIYPSEEQKSALMKMFGSCRYVYNWALAKRTKDWVESKAHSSYAKTCKALTELKACEETAWLYETSNVCLQQSLQNLDNAFSNFFQKKGAYPKFKSRRSAKASARFTKSGFALKDKSFSVARIKGDLKVRWSRDLPSKPLSCTVSKNAANQWFVSFLCEAEIAPHPASDKQVGVDLGVETFCTLSDGQKFKQPPSVRKLRMKLVKAQKSFSRKQKGSKNAEKARIKAARVHQKICNVRNDFLHKLSSQLARENQTVALEDLSVMGMMKDRRLSRVIGEQGWRDFRSLLEYKCDWYGRTFLTVDRYFPSSKTCSACGRRSNFGLKVRQWSCSCGATHDRDVNAAKNILAAGHAVKDCGADGRPIKGYALNGRPRRSSKAPERSGESSRLA